MKKSLIFLVAIALLHGLIASFAFSYTFFPEFKSLGNMSMDQTGFSIIWLFMEIIMNLMSIVIALVPFTIVTLIAEPAYNLLHVKTPIVNQIIPLFFSLAFFVLITVACLWLNPLASFSKPVLLYYLLAALSAALAFLDINSPRRAD
jgi:hypothetical protein